MYFKKAKELVEKTPATLKENVPYNEMNDLKKQMFKFLYHYYFF